MSSFSTLASTSTSSISSSCSPGNSKNDSKMNRICGSPLRVFMMDLLRGKNLNAPPEIVADNARLLVCPDHKRVKVVSSSGSLSTNSSHHSIHRWESTEPSAQVSAGLSSSPNGLASLKKKPPKPSPHGAAATTTTASAIPGASSYSSPSVRDKKKTSHHHTSCPDSISKGYGPGQSMTMATPPALSSNC